MWLGLLPLGVSFILGATPAADVQPMHNPVAVAAERPRLGVQLEEGCFPDPVAGLPIAGVAVGSTAAAMAFKAGDRLTSLNGKPLRSIADLQGVISEMRLGETVTAEVTRAGQAMTLRGTYQPHDVGWRRGRPLADVRRELDEIRRAHMPGNAHHGPPIPQPAAPGQP